MIIKESIEVVLTIHPDRPPTFHSEVPGKADLAVEWFNRQMELFRESGQREIIDNMVRGVKKFIESHV